VFIQKWCSAILRNPKAQLIMQSEKKILLTGAGGQLGQTILAQANSENIVAYTHQQLDLTDVVAMTDALHTEQPDIIINCAAWTEVDAAEESVQSAYAVNSEVPANIARWCLTNECYMLHISTDYVYSGEKPLFDAYAENDEPDPMSVYGQSKWQGEKNIIASGLKNYAILRTAWLYGRSGKNFLKTMLRLVLSDPGRQYQVVDDQFGSPTPTDALTRQIRLVLNNKLTGIYHATAHGHCSWYVFACEIFALLGIEHNLVPCSTADYPTLASRPKNSILCNAHFSNQGCDSFLSWQDELKLFIEAYGDVLIAEAKAAIG